MEESFVWPNVLFEDRSLWTAKLFPSFIIERNSSDSDLIKLCTWFQSLSHLHQSEQLRIELQKYITKWTEVLPFSAMIEDNLSVSNERRYSLSDLLLNGDARAMFDWGIYLNRFNSGLVQGRISKSSLKSFNVFPLEDSLQKSSAALLSHVCNCCQIAMSRCIKLIQGQHPYSNDVEFVATLLLELWLLRLTLGPHQNDTRKVEIIFRYVLSQYSTILDSTYKLIYDEHQSMWSSLYELRNFTSSGIPDEMFCDKQSEFILNFLIELIYPQSLKSMVIKLLKLPHLVDRKRDLMMMVDDDISSIPIISVESHPRLLLITGIMARQADLRVPTNAVTDFEKYLQVESNVGHNDIHRFGLSVFTVLVTFIENPDNMNEKEGAELSKLIEVAVNVNSFLIFILYLIA